MLAGIRGAGGACHQQANRSSATVCCAGHTPSQVALMPSPSPVPVLIRGLEAATADGAGKQVGINGFDCGKEGRPDGEGLGSAALLARAATAG